MKHYLTIGLCLILLFKTHHSSAQTFSPAKVFTISQDTIDGYILDFNWKINSNKIQLVDSLDGEITVYASSDIKGFSIENYVYLSAFVDNLYSSRHMDNLRTKELLKYKKEHLFIEVLAEGPKSLYALTSKAGVENYYILYKGEYQLLVFEKYYNFDGSTKRIVENTKYKGQLKYYFNDCPKVASQAERIGYDRASLISLFANYNQEIGWRSYEKRDDQLKTAPLKKKKNTVSEIGVYIGYGLSNMVFRSDNQKYIESGESVLGNELFTGISLDLRAPNIVKWLSFQNEFAISTLGYSSSYTEVFSEEYKVISDWKLSYVSFQTNHLLKCKLKYNDWGFYMNGGLHLYYRSIGNNKVTKTTVIEHEHGSIIQDNEEELFRYLKVAGINLVGGIGLSYWKVSLEARIETNTYLNKSSINQVEESCMYFLLRYTF